MNVSDNHYNLNIGFSGNQSKKAEQTADTTRPVTQNKEINQATSLSGNAELIQVSEKETFRGQILDITNNQVSIMLQDNKTLTAHMAEAVNLNIGDLITFIVKEKNGDSVIIKPYSEDGSAMKDSAIFRVLEQNSLSPTQKNYQIAESLINNKMPVDRAGMQKIMQQSYRFPDASIDTLIALNKLNIPVDEGSINQYEAYMSNNHQLMSNLNEMGNALSDFLYEQVSEMDSPSDIMEFNKLLLEIISDDADETSFSGELFGGTESLNGITDNDNPDITDKILVSEISALLSDKISADDSAVSEVIGKLVEMGFDYDTLKALSDSSDSIVELLNNINVLIEKGNLASKLEGDDLKSLLLSDGYRKLLNASIKSKMTIDVSKMKDSGELNELYSKIYEKAGRLLDTFSGGSPSGNHMNETAKGIQERLDFIQNLNNMYAYAQMPIKLSGNEMNSELFVYMNKRHMKESREDVSALLHLDMDHLGPTDVHVSLHGTSVHTRFYVEDEESARIIDEHMSMLEKAVNDSGYSLTNEVITREPSLATTGNMVVDEMLGSNLEQSVKRYSFDVRM